MNQVLTYGALDKALTCLEFESRETEGNHLV